MLTYDPYAALFQPLLPCAASLDRNLEQVLRSWYAKRFAVELQYHAVWRYVFEKDIVANFLAGPKFSHIHNDKTCFRVFVIDKNIDIQCG